MFLVTETNNFEKKTSKIIFLIKPCSEIRCTLPKLNKIFVNFVQVSFQIAVFLWLSLWRKILWTTWELQIRKVAVYTALKKLALVSDLLILFPQNFCGNNWNYQFFVQFTTDVVTLLATVFILN